MAALLKGVAHDLNNLLHVIGAVSGLLREKLEPASPFTRHVLMIEECMRRASLLTRKLQSFVAPVGSKSPELIDIAAIIRDVLRALRASVPFLAHLSASSPPGPVWAVADTSFLLRWLLEGALAAEPEGGEQEGGATAQVAVRLDVLRDEGVACVVLSRPTASVPDGWRALRDAAEAEGYGADLAIHAEGAQLGLRVRLDRPSIRMEAASSGGDEAARDALAGLVRQIASIVAQLTEKSGEEKESRG